MRNFIFYLFISNSIVKHCILVGVLKVLPSNILIGYQNMCAQMIKFFFLIYIRKNFIFALVKIRNEQKRLLTLLSRSGSNLGEI